MSFFDKHLSTNMKLPIGIWPIGLSYNPYKINQIYQLKYVNNIKN